MTLEQPMLPRGFEVVAKARGELVQLSKTRAQDGCRGHETELQMRRELPVPEKWLWWCRLGESKAEMLGSCDDQQLDNFAGSLVRYGQ